MKLELWACALRDWKLWRVLEPSGVELYVRDLDYVRLGLYGAGLEG